MNAKRCHWFGFLGSRSKNWLEDQFVGWMHNTWFTNFTWFSSGEWVLFVDLFELSAVVGKKLEIPSRCLVKIDPLFIRFRYWINFRTSCAKVPCAPIFIITKVMTWFGNKATVGLFCSTRKPHYFWYSVLAASWNSRHVVCSMIPLLSFPSLCWNWWRLSVVCKNIYSSLFLLFLVPWSSKIWSLSKLFLKYTSNAQNTGWNVTP